MRHQVLFHISFYIPLLSYFERLLDCICAISVELAEKKDTVPLFIENLEKLTISEIKDVIHDKVIKIKQRNFSYNSKTFE